MHVESTTVTQTNPGPFRLDDFMSSDDVGHFFGLSPRTLERFRLEGRGPSYFKFGRIVRYRRAEVMKWAEAQLRTSTSDPGLAA